MGYKEEILIATLRCDVQKVKEHLERGDWGDCCFGGVTLPQMSVCLDFIFDKSDEWGCNCEKVKQIHEVNNRMMDFWRTRTDLTDVAGSLDCKLHEISYSSADELEEDVLCSPAEIIVELKRKARQIDIDLFCAVQRFDFDEIEQLLELGANPEATESVESDFEYLDIDSLGFVAEELCYWRDETEFLTEHFDLFFKGEDLKDPKKFVFTLLHVAAYSRLWAILTRIRN